MKPQLYYCLAFVLLLFACKQEETIDTKIIIAGQFENPGEDTKVILYLDEEMANETLDQDGTFRLDLDSDESNTYMFIAGRNRIQLFLSPGDSIYISGDLDKFKESISLDGDRKAENDYLRAKTDWEMESGIDNTMEFMKLTRKEYFEKKEAYFSKQKANYESVKTSTDLHPDFVSLEEAYFEFQPLAYDLEYPMYHAYIHKISQDSVDFPKEESKEALKKLDLKRTDLLNSEPYTSLILRLVQEETSAIMKEDTAAYKGQEGYTKARLLAMDKVLEEQKVKDKIFFIGLSQEMSYRGPVHLKESYEKFMAENESPKLASKLQEIHDKWEPIMPGKEVPDFSFVNIENEPVQLSDLKGTLVYVDIWATWCGPCIAEHPHWDKMKEEYKDKPVSFLTISIDDSKEPWEKMVKAKNMQGLQWFTENAWKSDIAQHFHVNGIPRFLLLDKEGKIIDPSADRPSGAIRETLDKYL